MQAMRPMKNGARLRRCCRQRSLAGVRARRTCVMCLTPFCIWPLRAASGACSQTTSHRSRRFADISTIGGTMVFFERSTITWLWRHEKPWAGRPVHRRAWSIARASKPRKAAELRAMTRERRSRDASAISSPTRPACSSAWLFMAPTFRTAMAHPPFSTPSAIRSRGCAISSPTAVMRDPNSEARWTRSGNGPCKSSSDPMPQRASRSFPVDGWSNARSHGLVAAAGWPRTGNEPSPAPKHGCSSLTYGVSVDFWQGAEII